MDKSRQQRCAVAVANLIRSLPLTGTILTRSPENPVGIPRVYIKELFETSNVQFPCFIIHYGTLTPTAMASNNVTKDVGYRVGVTLCDSDAINQTGKADLYQYWREQTLNPFDGQRLPGVPQCYRCTIEYGVPFDPRLGQYSMVYVQDVIRCALRVSRKNYSEILIGPDTVISSDAIPNGTCTAALDLKGPNVVCSVTQTVKELAGSSLHGKFQESVDGASNWTDIADSVTTFLVSGVQTVVFQTSKRFVRYVYGFDAGDLAACKLGCVLTTI